MAVDVAKRVMSKRQSTAEISEKKSEQLTIRLTGDQRRRLDELARKTKRSVAYIALLCLDSSLPEIEQKVEEKRMI